MEVQFPTKHFLTQEDIEIDVIFIKKIIIRVSVIDSNCVLSVFIYHKLST